MTQASPSALPPLLRIPRKLRELIYEEILNDFLMFGPTIRSHKQGQYRYRHEMKARLLNEYEPDGLPLLFVCRTIFDELLESTASHVDYLMRWGDGTDLPFEPFATLTDPYLRNIRCVHIDDVFIRNTPERLKLILDPLTALQTVEWSCGTPVYLPMQVFLKDESKVLCLRHPESHQFLRHALGAAQSSAVRDCYSRFFRSEVARFAEAYGKHRELKMRIGFFLLEGMHCRRDDYEGHSTLDRWDREPYLTQNSDGGKNWPESLYDLYRERIVGTLPRVPAMANNVPDR